MKARWLMMAGIVACTLGCNPVAKSLPCMSYVAGGFNRENRFAFSVDKDIWPRMVGNNTRIELTFFFATGKSQNVDLVHVEGDHEIERWTLAVSTENGHLSTCMITADAKTSTCGASIHVMPHDPAGYWYLRGGDDLLEAGMTFVLCAQPGAPAPNSN